MGRGHRIGFAALAVFIAVIATLVLRSGGDERTEQADRPPAASIPTEPAPPGDATATPTEPPETTATTPTPTPAPEVVRFRDGKVVGGVARLRFKKGETVRFAVRSDVADEVHVHGYDLSKDVSAGGTVRFSFRATVDGIFEVELEHRGIELARLRVDP